jgi:hypothetical protein
MLSEKGMPVDSVKDLFQKMCKALLVIEMYKCTWDEAMRTLATKEEEEKQEEIKAFEALLGSGTNSAF